MPVAEFRSACNRRDQLGHGILTLSLALSIAAVTIVSMVLPRTARASDLETVLHNFTGTNDGSDPAYNLIMDRSGNLYGVTVQGGVSGQGTVFELMSKGGGQWTAKTLYSFAGTTDGNNPSGRLVMDPSGNLYGVTSSGGTHGGGVAYKLTSDGNGNWTETIIWNFGGNAHTPTGGLTLDGVGNLYGATTRGGGTGTCKSGCGVVFELSPPTQKTNRWKYSVLYPFLGYRSNDGQQPNGDLIFDAVGNLYGTTTDGGTRSGSGGLGNGTVFELSAGSSGWTEKVLYRFAGPPDGAFPKAGLTLDGNGNLYGTTSEGGQFCPLPRFGCGTAFELSPSGGGWTESLLYQFKGSSDGGFPQSPLVFNAGDLYGTTSNGGNPSGAGFGVVFNLVPLGGAWTENVLHNFTGTSDGSIPSGGVVFDSAGSLYGVTLLGGSQGDGVVYEISH